MNSIQLLLVIVVLSLTSLLLVIGYQVFLVVKEARMITKKINSLLDHPEVNIASFIEKLRKK